MGGPERQGLGGNRVDLLAKDKGGLGVLDVDT